MKLEIIENDSNYIATIVKLPELKKAEGLDNLMVASVFGYNCLVGKETYSAYKLKSQLFLTHETKAIDDGEIDTEEAN